MVEKEGNLLDYLVIGFMIISFLSFMMKFNVYNGMQILLNDNQPIPPCQILYNCQEDIKSGLCGSQNDIFPLNNKNIGPKEIDVYGPGEVLQTPDFKITLYSPNFLLTYNKYEINISIENLREESKFFRYDLVPCTSESACSDIYANEEIDNLEGATEVIEGKNRFFQVSFNPYEKKSIKLGFIANKPTLVKSEMNFLGLHYFDDELLNPYTIGFQLWIKPSNDYSINPEGKRLKPDLLDCGGNIFPSIIIPPRYIPGGTGHRYGYFTAKCCNQIFYPSLNCCSNNDCSNDRHCIDGKCIPDQRTAINKLFGTKKVLIGYEFNNDDTCEEIPLSNINPQIRDDFLKMEIYYDFMASSLLNKPSTYINFDITKVIKVPSGLNGFYNWEMTENTILEYLSSRCNININNFDIIVLPTNVATMGEAAGFAFVGLDSKIELYQMGNVPTLIHETGHLFGCTDLYQEMGGHLQWAKTLYGIERGSVYALVEKNFQNIPLKAFQVCRGELGWTDFNNNNIIDVEESE